MLSPILFLRKFVIRSFQVLCLHYLHTLAACPCPSFP
ncbi:hypothetical protein NC651_004727 [Populus alba x Populus x berolinensis]|nr:hypothetical protein NC651_004727 [Populus alba x Populus x berolinensis]